MSMQKMKKLLDFVMSPRNMLAIGVVVGLAIAIVGGWDLLEPTIGIATLTFAAAAWWQTKKAKDAYYHVSDNHDDNWVVALEVGRPISEAVKDAFGHCDALVRVQDVIGTTVLLTDEHYQKVAMAVYSACAQCQNRPIDLIVSGPNGLVFIMGQMLGLDRFRVAVHQYYNGEYQRLPRPTRDWLEHR